MKSDLYKTRYIHTSHSFYYIYYIINNFKIFRNLKKVSNFSVFVFCFCIYFNFIYDLKML